MSLPTLEVADLIRTHGDRFVAENRFWLSYQQLKVLRAIQRCRTPALGGHLDQCSGLRILAKVNADSEGNANGIPGRRRTVFRSVATLAS